METKAELAKAIIAVMNEVAGIEKSLTVGTGNSSYKGVSDKDVKRIIGNAMAKNGLCILPLDVDSKTTINRWEEMDNYSKQMKTKQLVFDEVSTKYLLLHTSGQSQVIAGHGHGVDSQDKSAGKATTYALKNALLYTFMIPTGDIDDTDKTHSSEYDKASTTIPQAPVLKANGGEAVQMANLLKVAIAETGMATDSARLKQIWEAYPMFHLNATFKATLNAKKLEINK